MKYSCYGLFIVLLVEKCTATVIRNPISDGIVFNNEFTHLPLFEA